MDNDLLGKYLTFFAKYDYALSRSGFCKRGRKLNGQADVKTIDADWDAFADKLPSTFYEEIKKNQNYAEIFKDGGPKVWAEKQGHAAKFHNDGSINDTKTLIYACKHIRNNLIHGEKLQKDEADIRRNHALLICAMEILTIAMNLVKDAHDITVLSRFEDIPISRD